MTTDILTKLGLTSWDQASAWVKARPCSCEDCVEYKRTQKCKYYEACKLDSEAPSAFFTRKARKWTPAEPLRFR